MRISLKADWEDKISGKAKVYSLDAKDKQLIDDIFDKLHNTEKLS